MFPTKQIFLLLSILYTFCILETSGSYWSDPENDTCPAKVDSIRGGAAEQLSEYKACQAGQKPRVMTTDFGVPVPTVTASLTAGCRGPTLISDVILLDLLSHLNRERIPERLVHAKGAGAFGYFKVTHDITKYCKAKVFESIGKITEMAVRFSTVNGERGSSDIVLRREHRGFALRFFTEEGLWDIVGNNLPVFLMRDAMSFSSLVHVFKRNPVTNLPDFDMVADFITQRPELVFEIIILGTGLGQPDGYRYMDGHGINTFKMVNATGHTFWCKFHYLSKQGVRNLTNSEAAKLSTINPDYATEDLYNAIHRGEYPEWKLHIQIMTMEQAKTYRYNPFDATKLWYEDEFPLIPVGDIVFNNNARNYFKDVEQIALCPAHLPPGIEPSPDKVLQGRLFAYTDAHRYRLGINNMELPINCPFAKGGLGVQNILRDGQDSYLNQLGAPNYWPNSFGGPEPRSKYQSSTYKVCDVVDRYESRDDDNFSQPAKFYLSLTPQEKLDVITNLAALFIQSQPFLQERAVKVFSLVDPSLGTGLAQALQSQSQNTDPMSAIADLLGL